MGFWTKTGLERPFVPHSRYNYGVGKKLGKEYALLKFLRVFTFYIFRTPGQC